MDRKGSVNKNFKININKIGFMQGRLVDLVNNKIQFFPHSNWENELEIAQENNLKIIEWTINYENIKKNPLYNGDVSIIKKKLKKNSIQCHSVTCDFFMQKPFFKKKYKNIKDELLNDLIKVIKNSEKVNIKYLIIPLVDKSSVKNKKEEKFLISNFIKYISPKLKSIKILFEIDYKPKDVMLFIKKFKSKKFGINYDTGNSASFNYNILDEMVYFKFVKNIHIKDRKKFGNTVDLGEGNWNHKLFFNVLKKISFKGNLILQTARSKNNDHVKKFLQNLKFIKKYL